MVLDQITKAIVRSTLDPRQVVEVFPGFHLSRVTNEGIAFGLFPGRQSAIAILTVLALCAIAIALAGLVARNNIVAAGAGLLVGGSIGNLLDRLVARRGDGLHRLRPLAGLQRRRHAGSRWAPILIVVGLLPTGPTARRMSGPADAPARAPGGRGRGRRGAALDAAVGALEEVGSRAEAQRLIEAGRVLVDGRAVPKRHLLAEGEALEVRPAPPPPSGIEPEDVPLTVRYEDDSLLVVDKPAGVVMHPSAGHRERHAGARPGGARHRRRAGPGPPGHRPPPRPRHLGPAGRRPLQRAHRRLQRLLRDREIDRRYLTLVHGEAPPALTIDRTVGRDRRVRTRMAVGAADGREAVTHLRRLEDLGRFSLLEARLETGRTHQIRVHLESVGHPVVGDRVYGRRPETLGLERQFLHAARLAFPHPETGEPIEVESPLPDDLRRALALARPGGAGALTSSAAPHPSPPRRDLRQMAVPASAPDGERRVPSARAGAPTPEPQHRSRTWPPSP